MESSRLPVTSHLVVLHTDLTVAAYIACVNSSFQASQPPTTL